MAAFSVTVSAFNLADAVKAFGLLHRKVSGGKHLHLYKLRTIHAGAFAAAWVACGVDVSVVAAAITVACNGRELADMTLPPDCHERCTGRVEFLSALGNSFFDNGIIVKRRFGCRRDLLDNLATTTTMPSVAASLRAPCNAARMSAAAQTSDQLAAHVGPVTEWDVCPSPSTAVPACFTELPDMPVEQTIGHFYISQAGSA